MKKLFVLILMLLGIIFSSVHATAQDIDVITLPQAGNDGFFGFSVTSGDFNGDGLSDVVVSSPSDDYAGIINCGKVFIYYGKETFTNTPDQTLILPSPQRGDGFGYYVASAGDTNNDGFDELIVSMNWGVDRVYLFMGTSAGLSDTPSVTFTAPSGYPSYGIGHEISTAGDVNGDGFDDIILAGVYIYYGSQTGVGTIPNVIIPMGVGGTPTQLSTIGDINGDGFDDIAINRRQYSPADHFEVKKSLEFDYPRLQGGALRQIHGYRHRDFYG